MLITPDHILCANAGDSRAILSKRSTATAGTGSSKKEEEPVLPLSFDHKPSNDAELNRVEQDGGFVRAGRVDGDLAVSRSFGDFGYKNCGVKGQKELSPERVLASERRNPSGSSQGGGGKEKDHRVTVHPDILIHTRKPLRDEFKSPRSVEPRLRSVRGPYPWGVPFPSNKPLLLLPTPSKAVPLHRH